MWIAHNALVQTRLIDPGETLGPVVRALLLGQSPPGSDPCPEEVHARYTARGPDGNLYPTWHPPFDPVTSCSFRHEHGSNPQSYRGYTASGLPLFGYSAAKVGIEEPHTGYKVFVANDDLNGHAWMITLNQETREPQRALQQFHTLDWDISDLTGQTLVALHLVADFGYALENCREGAYISGSGGSPYSREMIGQNRTIATRLCAAEKTYESWTAAVIIPGLFEAAPLFDIENPATVVDPADLQAVLPICGFLPPDQPCSPNGSPWLGNRRAVMHPGQWVANQGPETFYTNAYGDLVEESDPEAIAQFITQAGWDTRDCCGPEVVFRIQTYSRGIYIANPSEGAGSAEFAYRP